MALLKTSTRFFNPVPIIILIRISLINIIYMYIYILYRVNSWLTYGEPLHRLREFGVMAREMDLIDENTLSIDHMKAICCYM